MQTAVILDGLRPHQRRAEQIGKRKADFALLQLEQPSGPLVPVAVLLLDPKTDRLHLSASTDLGGCTDSENADIVKAFLSELAADALIQSGTKMLETLEATLSNTIRISNRMSVEFDDAREALAALQERYIPP